MAKTKLVGDEQNGLASVTSEDHEQAGGQAYRRFGLLNGMIIGLALATGVWTLDLVTIAEMPIPLQYPSILLGGLVLVGINGFTGWLTSRLDKSFITVVAWFGAALFSSLVIGYQPFYGRTLTVWLADGRFWGLEVYPIVSGDSPLAMAVAGFFIFVVLVGLAFLQGYRLEGIQRELSGGPWVARPWVMLLLPLPLVAIVGLATGSIVGDTSVFATRVVDQAIKVGRTYEGDLFALGEQDGVNYTAIDGVRHQMSADYSLIIGDINPSNVTTYVVAHFDNGAWINCRVVNDQLSYCYDGAPPYTVSLESLITGEELPESCQGCLLRGSEAWEDWFEARRANFAGNVTVHRLAQWGKYVLMRAEAEQGDYAIECWLEGIAPVRLESCSEVDGRS